MFCSGWDVGWVHVWRVSVSKTLPAFSMLLLDRRSARLSWPTPAVWSASAGGLDVAPAWVVAVGWGRCRWRSASFLLPGCWHRSFRSTRARGCPRRRSGATITFWNLRTLEKCWWYGSQVKERRNGFKAVVRIVPRDAATVCVCAYHRYICQFLFIYILCLLYIS